MMRRIFPVLLTTVLVLSACGGGGGGDNPPTPPLTQESTDIAPTCSPTPTPVAAGASSTVATPGKSESRLSANSPLGLVNQGNDCFINATLQLIVAVPAQSADMAAFGDTPANGNAYTAFFTAYRGDTANLDTVHRAVVNDIRAKLNNANGPGDPTDIVHNVFRLPIRALVSFNDITTHYQAGERVFDVSAIGVLGYGDLQSNANLKVIVYQKGAHYLAFVRADSVWYKVDDSTVTVASDAQLFALNNVIGTGAPAAGGNAPAGTSKIVFLAYN
jgi:hypothetical protein